MNLDLRGKYFLVTGAASGFGRAITETLIKEGARLLVNSRSKENLQNLKQLASKQVDVVVGDIATERCQAEILWKIGSKVLDGAVLNAGGPPAISALEANMSDWDLAYNSVMRWKIELTKKLLPLFIKNHYGRMVFIESISVKQPVENLVLSNAFRMAVVGYVKTLSQEVGQYGITMNIMAPGYHDTHAMARIIAKKSETGGMSKEEARRQIEAETLMGKMGDPRDFASLASWLLSHHSKYISGQTISVDGGTNKGVFG